MTYALVGAGRIARALVGELRDDVVSAWVRRSSSARALRRSHPVPTRSSAERLALGEVVLFAVPDGQIEAAAHALAKHDWDGRVALHFAGALGPEPLACLAEAGAATGLLHPLQALTDDRGRPFRGARARIEGDPDAVKAARRLARRLGLRPLSLPTRLNAGQRTDYHAAASLVANDFQVLFESGCELLVELGLSREEAADALGRLAGGALEQLIDHPGALTGPATRGDAATIRAHLRRLARRDRDVATAHRALARSGARRSGRKL